jgi:homogentisate 1,2-dioxygenase
VDRGGRTCAAAHARPLSASARSPDPCAAVREAPDQSGSPQLRARARACRAWRFRFRTSASFVRRARPALG